VRETDPTLSRDLEELLEPKGDPMSFVKWTTRSLAYLVKALAKQGHTIKKSALAELMHELGYSLKANKKTIEGISHPDRDQQFGHRSPTGKPSPMASMIWCTTRARSLWASTKRQRSSPWRVSAGGGSSRAFGFIPRLTNY
jgi:hypothetical protein